MAGSGQRVARGREKVQSSLQVLGATLGRQMGKELNDKATQHVLGGRQEETLHPQSGLAPCIIFPGILHVIVASSPPRTTLKHQRRGTCADKTPRGRVLKRQLTKEDFQRTPK